MPQIDFVLIFSLLKWFTYGAIAIYLLAAVGLTMLSARLGMRGGWMSWVPILNLFLLCRMARSSAAWILPALIPIVGLAVLSYLGTRVARRLGMPGVIGAMFGVPFVGAFLPIPMALGSGPLPEGAADTTPSPRPLVAGGVSLAVVTGLVVLGTTGFWLAGRMTRSAAPTAKTVAASLPAHTASTLTEFPIDTATTNPAKPTNVITQSFAKPAPGARVLPVEVKISAKQLPPWIPPTSLPAAAESVAAADYVTADAASEPVSVVTLTMRDEQGVQQSFLAPPSAAALALSEPGARRGSKSKTMKATRRSGEVAAFLPLINQARSVAPKRAGFGYREVGGGGYAAGIASYTNTRSAWLAFSFLEMARKVVPIPADAGIVIRPATIGNASGYFFSAGGELRGYVLRSGNSIIGLTAGKIMTEGALTRWAEAVLSKK